jgi:hypothetical protein
MYADMNYILVWYGLYLIYTLHDVYTMDKIVWNTGGKIAMITIQTIHRITIYVLLVLSYVKNGNTALILCLFLILDVCVIGYWMLDGNKILHSRFQDLWYRFHVFCLLGLHLPYYTTRVPFISYYILYLMLNRH